MSNPIAVIVNARGGGRRRARDVVVLAVAVVARRFGHGIAGPEDVVLVELVAGGGACAGAGSVGRRVGKRAEEAVGGCGLLVANSGDVHMREREGFRVRSRRGFSRKT